MKDNKNVLDDGESLLVRTRIEENEEKKRERTSFES